MLICGDFRSEYFKHFETVEYIVPTFYRMPHEHHQTNTEQSTENHEVPFTMVPVPDSIAEREGFQRLQTTCDDTRSKNGSITSMLHPMEYHTNHNGVFNKGLSDNLKLGEKRKYLISEDTVSKLNDCKEKRFKADKTFNDLKKPFYFPEKFIYSNPYFKQNVYATSDRLNGISKDTPGNLAFTALSNNTSKHLSGFKPEETTVDQKETKTLNLQTSLGDLEKKVRRVGGTESRGHSAQTAWSSFSKITQEKKSATSQGFISLDSTKYSFLTQMENMRANSRENAEHPAIPCPFCTQSFSKYPELKLHVQTHKYGDASGAQRHDIQTPVPSKGNSMLTPISSTFSRNPRAPSRVAGNGDDGITRATSVIHFAERKKENAGQ